MSNTRLGNLVISFTQRNARKRGATSSDAWNDSFDELSQDLGLLSTEWNNFLTPLTATLPDGTVDPTVDAFENGIDGTTVYACSASTASANSTFYNSAANRPYTIFEQFEAVYTNLSNNIDYLNSQIGNQTVNASQVPITDAGNLIQSTNVEGALQELAAINTIGFSHHSLSHLTDGDDHTQYVPSNGLRSMTGDLNLGGHSINGVLSLTIFSNATIGGYVYAGGYIGSGSYMFASSYTINSLAHLHSTRYGELQVTGGDESSSGFLTCKELVTPTTTGTINLSNLLDTNHVFTNDGQISGTVTFALPAISGSGLVGSIYTFYVAANQTLKVTAQTGNYIQILASKSASGGFCSAATIGNNVTLVAINTTIWAAVSSGGTWTVT